MSLYAQIVTKDASRQGPPFNYIEQLWDNMYLEGRWSLPINSNPYLALRPPPPDAALPEGSDPQIAGASKCVLSWLRSGQGNQGSVWKTQLIACLLINRVN